MSGKVRVAASHSTDTIMDDALQIVGDEVRKLKHSCTDGGRLDPTETKVLQQLVDLAIRISKDRREASMAHSLDDLSDDKLDLLLQEATSYARKRKATV